MGSFTPIAMALALVGFIYDTICLRKPSLAIKSMIIGALLMLLELISWIYLCTVSHGWAVFVACIMFLTAIRNMWYHSIDMRKLLARIAELSNQEPRDGPTDPPCSCDKECHQN